MRRVFEENLPFLELEKNSGIYELYVDGRISIGVSYEDIEKFEGEWLKDVYVFNLFVDGEYVNIEGEYVRDQDGNMKGADGLCGDGFQVVADAWNQKVLELGAFSLEDGVGLVRKMMAGGFVVPEEFGFAHCGQWILNPFYDETLRFEVEPLSYYGAENVRRFVDNILTKKEAMQGKEFVPGDYVFVLISDCCDGMAKVLDVTDAGMTLEMVEGRYWMIYSGTELECNPMEVPFEWIEEIKRVDPEKFRYGPDDWPIGLDDRISEAKKECENTDKEITGKPKEIGWE